MPEKQRILIADDEPNITDVLAKVLELSDYEVTRAFDGEECIQKALIAKFDLVLLDVSMPKMDGYEVSRQLKQMPHLKHTPIVFLSGYGTSPQNIEWGYEAGGIEYWKKPLATDELEARVRSILRTADAERKLRDMQESFTSMIVHDLRSPLSGIVGFADMLAEDRNAMTPQIAEMIDSIGTAAKEMLSIVTDFLEITRLESGDSKIYREGTDLHQIIEKAVDRYRGAIQKKSIQLNIDRGDIPIMSIDPDKIQRVLENLLDNATQFTPKQGAISISSKVEAGTVKLTISDSGEGISEEDLLLLFDKMRITMPGSKRPGSRTGLSLPICRGIIEAHRGRISVKSTRGKGAAFTISLPLGVS